MLKIGSFDWRQLTRSLIEQQYKAEIKPLELKRKDLDETKKALEQLRSKLQTIDGSVQRFREVNGGFLEKKAESSNSSVLTGLASGLATTGSFSVSVSSVAKAGSVTTGISASSQTSPIFSGLDDTEPASNRTLTLTIGTGSNATTLNIVVSSQTSLNDLRDYINANLPSTVGKAVIVNTGTSSNPTYELMIQANQTGIDKGSVSLTTNSSLSQLQNFVSSSTTMAASNAVFSINGISFTRETNVVSDAIPGVELNLKNIGNASLTVSVDADKTADKVADFVNAYNEMLRFFKSKNEVDVSKSNASGPLRNSGSDDKAIEQLRSMISGVSAQENGNSFKLAYFGVTTDSKTGELVFDREQFKARLSENSERVKTFFEKFGNDIGHPVDGMQKLFNSSSPYQFSINNLRDEGDKLTQTIDHKYNKLKEEEQILISRFSSIEKLQSRLQGALSVLSSLQTRLF
ncbi:MAG: flagellar filament capping protein FliD [Deltaproteobacteria bacterium]|nr:flagellar filament capping protein FliD [Deltaproteobacteria bacterium]